MHFLCRLVFLVEESLLCIHEEVYPQALCLCLLVKLQWLCYVSIVQTYN